MWWIIFIVFIILVLFTGGGLFGWLFQIIGRVAAFIAEGWLGFFGCIFKLFAICFAIYVIFQLLLVL